MEKYLDEEDDSFNWKIILSTMVNAINTKEMIGGYSPQQKVFGKAMCISTERQEWPTMDLDDVKGEQLRNLLNLQKEVRECYQEIENRDRINRALRARVRPHQIEKAKIGDKVFFKREGDTKWHGPGKVIGVDGKTVIVKQGALLRNAVRIHITRLQGEKNKQEESDPEESENEAEEEDEVYVYGKTEGAACELGKKEEEGRVGDLKMEESEISESEEEEVTNPEEDDKKREEAVKTKVKKGSKYEVKRKNEDFWRRIEITSRAGKAGGRWKNCYNFVDIDSGEKDWLNLDDNEEMLEINDSEEDLEDEEEFFMEGEIVYFENSKTNMAERVEIAKEKELENWREHKVYEEITKQQLPNDMKPLTTRWVITEKEKEGGLFVKARLVARGFLEKEKDLQCEAPTASPEGLKIVLSVILMNGWTLQSIDIKTAYLQSHSINRDVYIHPPKESNTGGLWKLKKPIYGLKDAARAWYDSLSEIIKKLGGQKSRYDPSIFIWQEGDNGKRGVMICHVDDICFGGNTNFMNKVIGELKKMLKIKSEECFKFKYLGIEVVQEGDRIKMDQNKYVQDNLRTNFVLRKEERNLKTYEQTIYRSLIGKLNWLAQHTRPDLSYIVSKYGTHMHQGKVSQLNGLLKEIGKLKKTHQTVVLGKLRDSGNTVEVFSDASFGNGPNGRTQIGYYIRIKDEAGNICPITWKSKVSQRVVNSTLAAETYSASEAIEWGMYIQLLWEEISGSRNSKLLLSTDSKSLQTALVTANGAKGRMLRIELAGLKEKIEENIITEVQWVSKKEQIADALTKEGGQKHLIREEVCRGKE